MVGLYKQHGVSAEKEEVHRALATLGGGLFPGGFARAVPDFLGGSSEHCCLLHADGAGTKASLAYLAYVTDGNPAVFEGIAQDALVMNLDDLMCVGAMGPFLMSNTIGRNAKLIDEAVLAALARGYSVMCDNLANHGIEVVPCGGETADVGDLVRTLIVDCTLATRMLRSDYLNADRIVPGQQIVGLASFGQAKYESRYNSGIGANGFTLARHEVLNAEYGRDHPSTFAPEISSHAYSGGFCLHDPIPGTTLEIGHSLLSPTRTYSPVMREVITACREGISAIFHNTGGGQTKCLRFGSEVRYIKDNMFPLPPVFELIVQSSSADKKELYQVYNMGHRLEFIVEAAVAEQVIGIAQSFGIEGRVVGRIERGVTGLNCLRIEADGASYEYSRQL